MKTIGVRDLQDNIKTTIADAQGEPVIVMRHARPVAVVIGVDGGDLVKVLEQAAAFKRREGKV